MLGSRSLTLFLPFAAILCMLLLGQSGYTFELLINLTAVAPLFVLVFHPVGGYRSSKLRDGVQLLAFLSIILFYVLNALYLKSFFIRVDKFAGTGVLWYLFWSLVPFSTLSASSSRSRHIIYFICIACFFFIGGRLNFLLIFFAWINSYRFKSIVSLLPYFSIVAIMVLSVYFLRDGVSPLKHIGLSLLNSILFDRYSFYTISNLHFDFNFWRHFFYPLLGFLFYEGDVTKYSVVLVREYFGGDHGVHLGVFWGLRAASSNSNLLALFGYMSYIAIFFLWYLFVRPYISYHGLAVVTLMFAFGLIISVFKLKFAVIGMVGFTLYAFVRRLLDYGKAKY